MKHVAKSALRGDIQGLRAVAVVLVVIYHLWPGALAGGFVGVDAFFVISGFLMTSHLVRNPPVGARDVWSFWMRRVKRLLPAAFFVLAATLLGIRLFAPDTLWRDWGSQVVAAAFYVENWSLAASSVDYLTAENAPSAVQHFWSLSVEEQFYLLWPLVIGGLFIAGSALGAKRVLIARYGVLCLMVLSFGYSIHLTGNEPGIAYFSTLTRGWEFAAGGAIALIPAASKDFRHSHVASALSWAGLAAILYAAVAYGSTTPFPGSAAALPVLGTAAVIWAHAEAETSPTRVLAWKPSRFLGDHSYSIYLWHWPLIVLLPFAIGPLHWPEKLGIAGATVFMAALTKVLIEDNFRRSLDRSRIMTGGRFLLAGSLGIGLISGALVGAAAQREQTPAEVASQVLEAKDNVGVQCFGAASMVNDCADSDKGPLVPEPAAAKNDRSDAYADKCWSQGEFDSRPVCTYGNGNTKVALVGNSHAGQWLPALQQIAKQRDWTISTFMASRCSPTDSELAFDSDASAEGCLDFGKWVLDRTAHGQFDLIIAAARQSLPVHGETFATTREKAITGYESYLEKWTAGGTPIVVIRDSPFPGNTVPNIPDCIASSKKPLADCSGTPKTWNSMDPLADAARSMAVGGTSVVDMSEFFCRDNFCPAIIGSVIAYIDGSHLTATYVRSLIPYLATKLNKVIRDPERSVDAGVSPVTSSQPARHQPFTPAVLP
ncbi:acyltransferase family protein [Paeniglutamicibacter sp. NPDC012692]|uniref:acyltransferase family protein n=1 Tax=Paeniglutamicibacter sp. NPDC012692 TaxID=3364388 RepID=UPI0036A848C9